MTDLEVQTVAEQLRDIFRDFERDGERAVARLEPLYDRDVVFRDPLQTVTGRAAFLAMNRRILARARRLSFEMGEALGGEDSLFLTWTMTYEPRLGPTIVFEGATHARLRDGRIYLQRDYWDMLSSLAQSLPGVRGVYAALAPHLA
jgi:limonene-1,2-epoxide hydrolase